MMPPLKSQFAKIHIAKKELSLSDESYRDLLFVNFGVESSKSLSNEDAVKLLEIFKAKGWLQKSATTVKPKKRSDNFITIKEGPAAAQQRKVLAMWNALGYPMEKLHTRCQKQFNVDRFEWLTENGPLHILITDLNKRLRSTQKRGKK